MGGACLFACVHRWPRALKGSSLSNFAGRCVGYGRFCALALRLSSRLPGGFAFTAAFQCKCDRADNLTSQRLTGRNLVDKVTDFDFRLVVAN